MQTRGEKIFNISNIIIMILICVVIIFPLWYTVVLSLNDGSDALRGGIYLWPRKFSLENYKTVFKSQGIFQAFGITFARTFVGVITHVLFTAMVAYAISKRNLVGRKLYITLGIITMFFNGGLIPFYLLLKSLGLIDNFMVYILPSLFSFFDLIIFQSFFREIPESLEESAQIDGANEFYVFCNIILPLSLPVIATIGLFNGVWHWNDYFTGVIFIQNPNLQSIQTFLYKVIAESQSTQILASVPASVKSSNITSESIKLATMILATIPIVCIYPFLQKYFVKGMLIGGVKE